MGAIYIARDIHRVRRHYGFGASTLAVSTNGPWILPLPFLRVANVRREQRPRGIQ